MKRLLEKIFEENSFKRSELDCDIDFFESENENKISYFIVNYLDCIEIENDEESIRNRLNGLEKLYTDEEYSFKKRIAEKLNNKENIAQIDKNMSAIYVLKFSDSKVLNKYKNLVYSIEESSSFFKRYVLVYSDKQIEDLYNSIEISNDKKSEKECVKFKLSKFVDNKEGYYKLMNNHGSNNSSYELAIRLFSKIPFLDYYFEPDTLEYDLAMSINNQLDETEKTFDKLLSENENDINEYIKIYDVEITDEEIENEIKEELK